MHTKRPSKCESETLWPKKFGHLARNARSYLEDKIDMLEPDTILSFKSNSASACLSIQGIIKWIGFWEIS